MTSEESTTPDLVERVRLIFELGGRRDWNGIMCFYAPDAVLNSIGMGNSFEGRAAIRGFFEDWDRTFEELVVELEEILDLGNGVIFGVVREKGRPGGIVGHVQQQEAWVWVWADGVIVQATVYRDLDEARAAAELLAKERG